ncbi:FAD-dependent monooxygenase [Microbacterium sp.]|uniref:FAD-dependent monooxygenase n=1 Tax=Microbacterium sp. TaxID=51671 RepID=UPI0039E615F7
MSAPVRVLVAGAGIAGFAVANALARRPGFEIDIVDPNPRPVGVAVGLSSCALRSLAAIDVIEPVLAASAPSMTLHMCSADGTTLVRVDRQTPEGQPYPDNVIVDRESLARALAAPLAAHGIEVVHGVAVTGVTVEDGGATVSFDGRDPQRYDLVVGADGIGSRLRGIVIDERPRDPEQLGLRWVMNALPGLDHGTMYIGPRAVKIGLWPLGDGSVYAFLTLPRPGLPRADRQEVLDELREVLTEFSFPGADQLRAEVPWDDVHIAPFQSLAPDAPWRRGRLVLVGDAVHAMPPHGSSGAAMAIEDAFVLADELGRAGVDEALEAFGRRRVERVRRVVEYSTRNCLAENEDAVAGRPLRPMDAGEAVRFWEFLRTEP